MGRLCTWRSSETPSNKEGTMRFYLLDFNEFIDERKSRIIIYGDGRGARNNIQYIRWDLNSPPFEVIKRLRVKREI